MKIEYLKSPNFEQVKRRNIKYIIIHYTGMKTAQESIKRLRSKKHKGSSHYFVNERGKITPLTLLAPVLAIINALIISYFSLYEGFNEVLTFKIIFGATMSFTGVAIVMMREPEEEKVSSSP